jgi:hypothetical protein
MRFKGVLLTRGVPCAIMVSMLASRALRFHSSKSQAAFHALPFHRDSTEFPLTRGAQASPYPCGISHVPPGLALSAYLRETPSPGESRAGLTPLLTLGSGREDLAGFAQLVLAAIPGPELALAVFGHQEPRLFERHHHRPNSAIHGHHDPPPTSRVRHTRRDNRDVRSPRVARCEPTGGIATGRGSHSEPTTGGSSGFGVSCHVADTSARERQQGNMRNRAAHLYIQVARHVEIYIEGLEYTPGTRLAPFSRRQYTPSTLMPL